MSEYILTAEKTRMFVRTPKARAHKERMQGSTG